MIIEILLSKYDKINCSVSTRPYKR